MEICHKFFSNICFAICFYVFITHKYTIITNVIIFLLNSPRPAEMLQGFINSMSPCYEQRLLSSIYLYNFCKKKLIFSSSPAALSGRALLCSISSSGKLKKGSGIHLRFLPTFFFFNLKILKKSH